MNIEEEVNGIVDFIQREVAGAGKTGCVVGISGGVDSAVVAYLCLKAFPETTYFIQMPEETQIMRDSTIRSTNLIKGEDQDRMFMSPVRFDKYIDATLLEKYNDVIVTKKAIGNYLARQRMATLYLYAETLGCLVVGTDNKSENYLGFFTKYGDGGVDINPIGKYLKSEVYELAKYLGVPQEIIEAVPSAELWDGQTDEEELGFTYAQFEDYANGKEVPDDVLVKIGLQHIFTSHKRTMPKEYK